ncbi:Protocadherin Fat 2 [Eumeta japonica]|uniref:Protocadherin Fat 2 n=1 Tax=Eumeta variegata TaxID=151549 RepID=A0A4C1VB44_EUMVA|nr:Protocadherin Fat 2 [Eumeta japonica]
MTEYEKMLAAPYVDLLTRRCRDADGEGEECGGGRCAHGGRCVPGGAGRVCACAGQWGGPHCTHYVGYDGPCVTLACEPRGLCVWRDDSHAYCLCAPEWHGDGCQLSAARPGGGAWAGVLAVSLVLAAVVLGALYVLRRRRRSVSPWRRIGAPRGHRLSETMHVFRGVWGHARLSDNVEISNPMYLAGADDEPEPVQGPTPQEVSACGATRATPVRAPPHRTLFSRLQNGSNHFANPVYESMYAAEDRTAPPHEERAGLLEGAARARGADAALL